MNIGMLQVNPRNSQYENEMYLLLNEMGIHNEEFIRLILKEKSETLINTMKALLIAKIYEEQEVPNYNMKAKAVVPPKKPVVVVKVNKPRLLLAIK